MNTDAEEPNTNSSEKMEETTINDKIERDTATGESNADPKEGDANDVQEGDEIAALKEQYVRLYSDFENFRRRTAKERLELMKTAGAEALKPIIPVIDDLERAIETNKNSEDIQAIREGFVLIQSKLLSAFKAKGITEINPIGNRFDVEFHEAVARIPAPEDKLKGCVVDVLEKGYLIDGHILRFAKVVVGE